MTQIRRAIAEDKGAIAAIIAETWSQDLWERGFHAHIQAKTYSLWVAERQAEVLGFVSAFLTRSKSDQTRWEIDLLAVKSGHRGQGLGKRLIAACCQDGARHAVDRARALIRVENVASQAAFTTMGFRSSGQVHELLAWPPRRGVESSCPEAITLLPVDTLTYRGLWIEGLESLAPPERRRALKAARAVAARESRHNTGTVLPVAQTGWLTPQLRTEAIVQEQYDWFVKPINKHDQEI